VIGPQHLRPVGELCRLKRFPARQRRGKGAMAGRMPVLCQQHMPESLSNVVDKRNDLIAAWHSQRAAGAKVVLDIDHEQNIAIPDLDCAFHISILCGGYFRGTLFARSANQTAASASEGMRQSPRGDSEPPDEILGP